MEIDGVFYCELCYAEIEFYVNSNHKHATRSKSICQKCQEEGKTIQNTFYGIHQHEKLDDDDKDDQPRYVTFYQEYNVDPMILQEAENYEVSNIHRWNHMIGAIKSVLKIHDGRKVGPFKRAKDNTKNRFT